MRILVTRPRPDAEKTAAALRERGVEPVVAPMMEVRPLDATPPDPASYQALAFTSANGVRTWMAKGGPVAGTALTVGDATAEAAREAGFADVASAGGEARDLAALVKARLDPADGPLLHACGRDIAVDLEAALDGGGFRVIRLPLYAAEAVAALPPNAAEVIRTRTIKGVALFSARSARTFVALTHRSRLADRLGSLTAYCLSDQVAAALGRAPEEAPAERWQAVRVAPAPTSEALLDLIINADRTSVKPAHKDEVHRR